MYIDNWYMNEEDPFVTCNASLKEGLTPLFMLRAVKICDGNYEAIVRDYITKKMLASRRPEISKGYPLDIAKNMTIEMAQVLIIFDTSEECILTGKYICPHKSISGKHCSYCKLPNLLGMKKLQYTFPIQAANADKVIDITPILKKE